VSVKFEIVSGNATASIDFFFTSNNVVLSAQEMSKPVSSQSINRMVDAAAIYHSIVTSHENIAFCLVGASLYK